MRPEYAVYKGENLLVVGTAKECAEEMGVTERYIYWLTMPSVRKRIASRKKPDKATTAVRLDDEE
ncbi:MULTISPECIES: hypothetical protein [unclassified Paenibacillus]|uniref:hypothetical protein n=1 Tax=unclassified Paenibacillus TaxID=185978 RepID=UPI000896755B|nr:MULTISPECIES: hypothetical protein [unclassified Paenibacillus]MCM3130975.1 hypothetical protein [Paenibacillus sp. MER 78]SDX04799.1 hypothetical protein SAMN05518848_104186 [Paenibacillus sp. PDC88]